MPRTKSAKKRLRQTIKKTIRNRQIKSRVKNSIKKFLELIKDKKIEGIHILDAYMECCYGTEEICDFEDMLKQ